MTSLLRPKRFSHDMPNYAILTYIESLLGIEGCRYDSRDLVDVQGEIWMHRSLRRPLHITSLEKAAYYIISSGVMVSLHKGLLNLA